MCGMSFPCPCSFRGTLRQLEKNWSHEVAGRNLPAPKVPSGDNLLRTILCSLVQLQLGGEHCRTGQGAESALASGNCTFCISAQHRPNSPCRSHMSATWIQLRANFGPTLANKASTCPTWLKLTFLGATPAQVETHMAPKWGILPARPNTKSSKIAFSLVFYISFWHRSCALSKRWAQLGAKLPPSASKLRHVGPTCAIMCIA